MELYHKDCGGIVEDKICKKCKKKWGHLGFVFATDLRVLPKETTSQKTGPKLPNRFTSPEAFADSLPKWPRWIRIVIVVCILLVIVGIVLAIKRVL